MGSRLLWRRSAAAAGLYLAVALGILGTIVAARRLGIEGFGIFATAAAAAALFQTLLDLTVEESLTKYGFRYVLAGDWGRLRRLFGVALRAKLLGGLVATVALVLVAPVADEIFGADGLAGPILAIAALPLVQAPESVASTALLLHSRYDVRGAFMALSMVLRLAAIVIGTRYGVTETLLAVVIAQTLSTGVAGAVGIAAFRRFPTAPPVPIGPERGEIVSFVLQSSAATGMLSVRSALAPLLLGVVAGPTQVGLLRVANAPQSGLAAASSPVRLILLTEQTREWERGRQSSVLAGISKYMAGAGVLMAAVVPVFVWLMPDLIRVIFGGEYLGAIDAARIAVFAAALSLVFGWTKSLPVSIGRPGLRITTHGIETAVLLPLVIAFGGLWGVTGASLAVLIATIVFCVTWLIVLARLRDRVAAARERQQAEGALAQ